MRRTLSYLVLLLAGMGLSAEARPRTMLTAVEEYLGPLRSTGVTPYEPSSIRLSREGTMPAGGQPISSARLRELLAPCGRGNMSAGYLSPSNRRDFRIRQEWRCERAVGYSGLVASFTTSQQGKRVADVEIMLRDRPFASPAPPPPMMPPPRAAERIR